MSAYGGRGNANPGIAGNRPAIPREDVKLDELEPDLKALIQNRMQKRGLTMDDKCCLCGDIRRDHKLRECGFLWSLTKSGRERILQRRAEQLTGKADPGRQMNMLCLPADNSGPGMYAFEEDDSDWVNIDRMQAAVLDIAIPAESHAQYTSGNLGARQALLSDMVALQSDEGWLNHGGWETAISISNAQDKTKYFQQFDIDSR